MELYEWLILIVAIGIYIGCFIFFIRRGGKVKWEVTLRDGASFIGRRSWRAIIREGVLERAYQVVDSQNSSFKENMIVVLGFGSILYRVKL